MKLRCSHAIAWLITLAFAVPGAAQDSLRFADLAGWWSTDPLFAAESSHLALQFVEDGGVQKALLSIEAIGAFDMPLGAVTFSGNFIDTKELSFPLTWDPENRSLTGHLPADLAPMYGIPVVFKRSEAFEKPVPRNWNAPSPNVLWSLETGAPTWAGIERAEDGVLFVGDEQGLLHAIDGDGKKRWQFATGKPIRAQPKVMGAHVYVASDSGYLYKLNRQSGVEVWRARIDSGSAQRIPTDQEKTRWDQYGSSVVGDGQRLFVASRDKVLYALDVTTGRELWRVAATDIMTATPTIHGDSVIFAAFDGKVQAVSAKDGALRWTYDAKLAIAGDVVAAGDRVLVGSRSYELIALDASTGKEIWKHYYWFSWIESPPVVRDGVIYTGSSDATNIYAINLTDGSLRWKSAVPGWSWQRTAVDNDLVVAGTVGGGALPGGRSGSLVALDRQSGKIRWIYMCSPSNEIVKSNKNWGFAASPVIAPDVVYASSLNGKVYAFSLN